MTKPCEWDHKTLWFTPFCFPPSFRLPPSPPLGWAGEGQHGEADILRPVSSWEARPYRSLPVWEIVKGCGPTQIRVSITSQSSFDILNNFFCAAHWVNRLEFRTNKIKMLISPWEEFVDMEANLSFLSKTKPTWHVWDDQWWSFCTLCTYLMCHRSCFLLWLMTTTVIDFSNAHSLYRLHLHLAESS